MKAILEFNLPEDTQDFELAIKGGYLSFIISDFDQKLRAMEKYEDTDVITIESARNILREIMEQYDITFDNKIFN